MARQDGKVTSMRTITIPPYTATDEEVEEVRRESLLRHGIPYSEAKRNVQETALDYQGEPSSKVKKSVREEVPAYEVLFDRRR